MRSRRRDHQGKLNSSSDRGKRGDGAQGILQELKQKGMRVRPLRGKRICFALGGSTGNLDVACRRGRRKVGAGKERNELPC